MYVQYGCGFSPGEGWENFDNSPTLRIERLPFIGNTISALFSGNSRRFPNNVRYGDIRRGLPIADGAAKGCYASHVLEHLSLQDLKIALFNTFRILEQGGIFRLIVPDLHERARRYIAEYEANSPDAASFFLRSTLLGHEKRPRTFVEHLRFLAGNSMHLWMWDDHALSAELQRAGFENIRRCQFGDSPDPMFAKVEDETRFVDRDLNIHECAIEAFKPTQPGLFRAQPAAGVMYRNVL